MATRAAEKRFARRAFGADGERFFAQSCTGCHVAGCDDCHGAAPHHGARLKSDACTRCHKGYFVGWDYLGRAPREDHERYQRGAVADGEPFLKMLPDVHAERGMTCADCHTMRSLQEGRKAAKTCRDCHAAVSRDVPEHAFSAHLEKMECEACHAAWAPQEYGTFLVRPRSAGAGGGVLPPAAPGARGGRAPTSSARTRRPWVSTGEAGSLRSDRSSSCSPPTRAGAGRIASWPRSGEPSSPTPFGAGR